MNAISNWDYRYFKVKDSGEETKQKPVAKKPYFERGVLNRFRGLSNAELLEHWEVRELFQWQSTHYPDDSAEDLVQQAFLMFISSAPITGNNPDNFGGYLVTAVRHIVGKAHIWRHRKKRHLPAMNFPRNEDGKILEPKGQRAAILFNHDEVTQIRATIWRKVRNEERRAFILNVLDGFLDGESAAETSRRLGVKDNKIHTAKRSLLVLLKGGSQ